MTYTFDGIAVIFMLIIFGVVAYIAYKLAYG